MPQIVEVEGVGEIEFEDGMTPDQIRSAIEKDILPQFPQQKVIQAVPVEPPPTTDNLFGRLGASISENASLAVQGLGQVGRYSPQILIGQGIANLVGAGDIGPRRNLERAIDFAGDVQAESRPAYGVTTPADTLVEQVVEGVGSLPTVVAAGPAAPIVNAAIMGESQRQEAEAAGASPLVQAASFAGAAGVGALSEYTLGIPAMLRGGGGRRLLDTALLGVAREGTQEAVDTAGQNVVAKGLYDPDRDLTQGVKEAGVVGGIIGGPLGPLMQGAREGAPVSDAPDLTGVAAVLEEPDEVDLTQFGSQARETAVEEVVTPPVTLAQQASANLLGTDATELRQQEAIVTGQPVPVVEEEVTEEVVEPALEPVEEVAPVAVEDEIVAEEGVDPTPVPEGLVALEPDTFERLADEPVQEGFVALQDPETKDVFQVPVAATPEQIQEARTAAREQSQMAEIQFLREENARKFEEARKEQDVLESIVKDPILRKNLTSGEKAREIWDVPSNLKFQLERQEMNLRKAQAGTLKDSDGKPVPPAALEKGVQMLRDRYAELTAKVEPAKEAVKGMKRAKGAPEGGAVGSQGGRRMSRAGEIVANPIESPEFKSWFGNSKITSKEGTPLVLVHVTDKQFNRFTPGGKNQRDDIKKGKWSGRAIWMKLPTSPGLTGHRGSGKTEGSRTIPLFAKIEQPMVVDDDTREFVRSLYGRSFPQIITDDAIANLKADNYDGVIEYEKGHKLGDPDKITEVVVFEPNQVKSAIGNSGKFNPKNPDISASTQIPQAIVDLGESLYRQGVEFKDWSRAMIRNLGDRVRPILKQIWNSIVNSVNALSPAQRRRIEGRMQRSAPAPEGGAFGGQGGRRFQQAQQEGKTFTGLEGKERYEIDDSQMEVVGAPEVGESSPLGEVISHPELFDSYPEAANIKVKAVKGPPGASFNSTRNEITLSEYGGADLSNSRYYRRALLHEIQHWIQDKEGFARGGSVRDWNRRELRQQIEFLQEDIRNIEDEGYNSPEDADLERDSIRKKIQRLEKAASARDAYDYYERLAGEYEARDVSNRISLTREERASTSPYSSEPVPDKGLITRFGKGVMESRETSAETPAPEEDPIGIANANVARGRERIGLGPRFAPARRTFGEAWNQAMDMVGKDPAISSDLVADLTNNPRPVTDTEVALLVYERIVLENRYDQAVATTNTASTEAEVLSGQESINRAQQKLDQLYKVTEGVGTSTARALNARKLLANRDLSLARMRAETQAIENNGQPLTPEQEKRIADLYSENKRLRDALEKLEEAQEKSAANQTFAAMMKEFKSERKEAVKTGKTVTEFLNEQADKARERLRSKMARTSAGVDPTILVDVAIIGASHIANGISSAADFSARIIQEFGEDFLPHMPEIFQQAQDLHASNTEAFGAKTETQAPQEVTPADILKEVTPELNPRLVFELARAYVRQGMTGMDQVMERIHQDLLPTIPDLTLREVRDAFSGYGKVTYPSKAEDLVKLREMRVLARLTSQLEDVQRRTAPLRTGPQRDAMTAEARILQKQISDLMRKYDLRSSDPLQQLKTSREAVKTRLRNEIEELEQAIQTRTPRPANRTPVEYDAETKALQARRDQVRARYEELFPRAAMTPEQRVAATMKALDKAIAEESQMLRDGILQRPKKAPGVSTPAIENKQMELDALRQLRRELFAATQPRKAPEDIALEQATKAAQASIKRMDEMLRSGNLDPAKRDPKFTPTVELEALWSERDAMRDALAELRRAQKPRTDPEERARKQTVKMLEKSIKDLDRRITTGDFSATPRKATRPDVKEVSDLRDLRDQMRKTFNDLKKAQTPTRSPEEIALSRDKKNIRTRIAKLQEKIANNDYAPAPKKVPAMDREKRQLQFDYQKVRAVYLEGLLKAQLRNRTLPKKIFGTGAEVLNTSRAILTSMDFSGVLRQGGFIAFGNPVRASKSLIPMFKAFVTEKGANDVKEEIQERPNYQNGVYQQAKLYLADDAPASLSSMEEAYMSRWANKIPLVAGSQRAYVTFLNKLRADSFDAMAATLALNGNPTLEESRAIANFVNVATGRGDLGKLAGAGVALNTVFFAPRYVLSRFQILAGQPFYGGNARTRKMIAKEYAKYLVGIGIVTALLGALADDEDAPLETDPRSSDFLKVRMGNTRLDPFSGLLQVTTLLERIRTGEIKSQNKIVPIRGEKLPYGSPDTSDIMFRFVRTKFSPVLGTMWDLATGKNVVGEPVTAKEAALKGMVPISASETIETMKEQGVPRGTALMLLSMFGVGLQTYEQKAKASKMTKTDFGPTMK